MKSKFLRTCAIALCFLLAFFTLAACNALPTPPNDNGGGNSGGNGGGTNEPSVLPSEDDNDVSDIDVPSVSASGYKLVSSQDGQYTFAQTDDQTKTITLTAVCSVGTDCITVTDDTITFGAITEKTEYELSGEFYGKIVIDVGDENKFELALCGLTLTSLADCPLQINSGDKVTVSAKKDTQNYIYDLREAVGEDDTAISSAIYAQCDLAIQGKGELYVKSVANNGIHTKDDLSVKNLTLTVSCADNALKGNDSVTIESGNLTLIATSGDGIKTKNSDVSSKGNRRGDIVISGGTLLIYAACDGIDAAYNAQIGGETKIEIFTQQYSKFTQSAASTSAIATNAFAFGGGPGGGRPGGGGMPDEGNTEKSDVSTKGIKAANDIQIDGGTIFVTSYDDCIHANSDETLEDGNTSTGNIAISGGVLTLYSHDDAIHADGNLTVSGGEISVTYSYEGLEATVVQILGGKVSVVASDDGINGTGTSGSSIVIGGGEVYVYAGGDGLDSNSTTSNQGILFSGGKCVIISYGNGDSSIDTERGYAYQGGTVVAYGGGMSRQESAETPNFSSVGKQTTLSVAQNEYLVVDGIVTVQMPKSFNNAVLVILGATSASVSAQKSTSLTLDSCGVAWQI